MGGRSESSTGGARPELEFEWDPNRSASNKEKHGVDFEQAKALWDDPARLPELLEFASEQRWALTATMDARAWRVIWTPRGKAVRIISVRRASRKEARAYGAQAQQPAPDQRRGT
ncbi:MAG: BrnT family toxin [Bifidobacteriaceae bacterium]|nr:BrnT family toxin [Bifidobacteriaceae bacterium]